MLETQPITPNPTSTTTTTPTTLEPLVQKPSKLPIITLTILLLITLVIAGYFGYMYYAEISKINNNNTTATIEEPSPAEESSSNDLIEPTKPSKNDIVNWQNHLDYSNAYTIKYPAGWRIVTSENGNIGVGPQEIGHDVAWTVNAYDSSTTNAEDIISKMGKQFDDRVERREDIIIWAGGENIKAIKVIVTTPQLNDWRHQAIILEYSDKIFVINGSSIDKNDFKLFYNSFSRLG